MQAAHWLDFRSIPLEKLPVFYESLLLGQFRELQALKDSEGEEPVHSHIKDSVSRQQQLQLDCMILQ